MAEDKKGEINNEFNSANVGLNMDLTPSQISKGSLTYALNATIENFDANGINYQNEPGNEFCLEFPKNYTLVGKHFIQERNKHIFFLANPFTGDSEIGYMDNNDCMYRKLVNAKCLNFSINHPIPKIVHRITNCTTELYWPDQNGRRFLDIDNIPYILAFGSEICNPSYSDELDCNQLKIQPDFAIPQLNVAEKARNGGSITAGTVQFAFQYSDALGNGYTSYYSVTNPTPIADTNIVTVNFNYPVGKSIVLNVSNIELSGKFKYFNIAVIKTVNDIASVELVGTYPIENSTKEIIYSGQNVSNIRLTINDIFEKYPVYDAAEDITTVSDVLVWKGLTTAERISYQKIANKISLQWETWRIPPGEDYSDEYNATNLRGYLRDEIYPFEFVPILRNGKQCDGFHIPARMLTNQEKLLPKILSSDPDYIDNPDNADAEYWKIYNTATNLGKSPGYSPDLSYKGPYEFGDFAYWESEEEYPCDENIWGELSGQKIRHHKFPDVNISPIFDSKVFVSSSTMEMGNTAIFPIGVKIDVQQIKSLIAESDLTDEQKNEIVGFKIARGNRGTNKSVIAKGILRNVNKYEREEQTYYFPNYPYNDLNDDPFINSVNNAYRNECEPFIVYIFQFNASDAEGPYTEIQYNDCNTNKLTTEKYRELGTFELCSIGKPIMLGPGSSNIVNQTSAGPKFTNSFGGPNPNVAAIKYANYDVWRVRSINVNSGPCSGWEVQFEDAVMGTDREWVTGFPNNETYILHVRVDTEPVRVSSDVCGVRTERIQQIRVPSCTEDKKLLGIKEDPTLAYRQIFNSPETSFAQPFLGNILKLESVIFGRGEAHFVQVKDNAKYRLLTEEAQRDALASAQAVGNITEPHNAAAMFTVYQSYLTIYINGITKKNYAYSFNSRADYSYSVGVPDEMGVKQRRVDLKKYLIPVIQNVGEDDIDINNYQRETSVYLRTEEETTALPFPDKSPNILAGPNITEYSRFTIGETGACATPENKQNINVVSYYGSIKNTFPGQWGQLYSYETIDTGFQVNLYSEENNPITIFGGDTFINRFAFKTKVPFFIDNRVGAPDDSDIFYDELGNIGYPKYWHSARSVLKDYSVPGLGTLYNVISFKDHYFDCPNSQEPGPPNSGPNRTFYDGYFYLFSYGIPNFYVESSYNVDLRQAFNNREGEFWPHVSSGIPDDWLQESFVSIANDNTYNYNVTYSKQNKENFISHLPSDFSTKKCFTVYPFRAIYSDPETADADNRFNNWLTYRASSYFDFPQNYGKLTSIDGIENRQLLARFENKSLLYNALYTNQTNTGGQVYLGQPLFSPQSPPLDFAETDLGYVGSQHKFLLKIPYGQISIDAKRGQVFLLTGNQAKDLSAPGSGMNRFFTDHLAFEILRFFPSYEITDPETKEKLTVPGVNVDNNFKDIGLHGVYDSKYDRMIITKLDYIPIDPRVRFDSALQEFYIEEETVVPAYTSSTSSTTSTSTTLVPMTTTTTTSNHIVKRRIVVSLNDSDYFCNKSWTVSYSFITNTWTSFHSYLPNWYIGENNFFYSGVSTCCDDDIDFTFIGGELVPNPPTTTTTSSSTSSSTSTTSTTLAPLDCVLIGGSIVMLDCALAGTGVITVPPVDPPCQLPGNVVSFFLITGYNVIAPPSNVVSTGSSLDACNAITTIQGDLANNVPTSILAYASSIAVGKLVYAGSADCTFVPDGWYFTEELMNSGDVFHVVSGVITEITNCMFTTTTTSSTTFPPAMFRATVEESQTGGEILGVTPELYTLDPSCAFPAIIGQPVFGVVNDGGNSLTVNYSAYIEPVTIQVLINNVVFVEQSGLPIGTNLYLPIFVNWNFTDSLEIKLL